MDNKHVDMTGQIVKRKTALLKTKISSISNLIIILIKLTISLIGKLKMRPRNIMIMIFRKQPLILEDGIGLPGSTRIFF
jgi:hypothetical protein